MVRTCVVWLRHPFEKMARKASCGPHKAARMDVKVANEVTKHFKVADGICLTGGSKKWQCIACEKVITGSATKL